VEIGTVRTGTMLAIIIYEENDLMRGLLEEWLGAVW
jgi:hypothetical protein